MGIHDSSAESLLERIGCNQAKAPGPARGNLPCGSVPPIHHVIGRLGHLPVNIPQRFGVAFALYCANIFPPINGGLPMMKSALGHFAGCAPISRTTSTRASS